MTVVVVSSVEVSVMTPLMVDMVSSVTVTVAVSVWLTTLVDVIGAKYVVDVTVGPSISLVEVVATVA